MQSEIHADLLLLQCGTKPYEIGCTLRLQKWFEREYAYILCPFVSEDAKGDYADALQSATIHSRFFRPACAKALPAPEKRSRFGNMSCLDTLPLG